MIYLTGDVHYPIDKEKLFLASEVGLISSKDVLLVTGDFGVVWESLGHTLDMLDEIKTLPYTILWIDGNHEHFPLIESFPVVSRYDNICHKLADNCYHLCRGNIYTIEGHSFLALGGAMSTDRYTRTKGIDWFPEEELDGDVVGKVLNKLYTDMRVDYVVSHDCPAHILEQIYRGKEILKSRTSDILSIIDAQIDCTKWFFGHHHINKSFCNDKYYCLYNTIVDLEGTLHLQVPSSD